MHKQRNRKAERDAPVFFRRRDVWVAAAILLAAAVLVVVGLWRRPGAVALVTVAGDEAAGLSIPLDADGLYHVEGRLPVTLEVADGAVRFVQSVCPDHDCEGFGWLRREGDWALCAPAGVHVVVEERR